MKTSATDISLAKRLVNKMSEYSPEEILADVLKMNQSGLTEENADAIRICYLVKKNMEQQESQGSSGIII